MSFFSYAPVPESSPYYFEPFSPLHFAVLATMVCVILVIVAFRKRLAAWKGEPRLRVIATIVAIAFEAGLHLCEYFTVDHYAFLRGLIPFELCAVDLWLAVALNASKRKWIFDLLYFWGLGAVVSYIFANTDGAGWNTFEFWEYFIVHGYIILTMAWFASVHGYVVRFGTFLKSVAILFPITLAVRFFDVAFSAEPYRFNFMFLLSPPDVHSPLDNFGHGWGYYFAFILLSVAVFLAVWVPWGAAAAARRMAATSRSREGAPSGSAH